MLRRRNHVALGQEMMCPNDRFLSTDLHSANPKGLNVLGLAVAQKILNLGMSLTLTFIP
jgi:hypothetical protein